MSMIKRRNPDPGRIHVMAREYCIEHDLFMMTEEPYARRLEEPKIEKMARLSGLGHTTLIPYFRAPGRRAGISFDTLSRLCALLHCQPGDILHYEPHAPGRHNIPADPRKRTTANALGLT